MDKEQLYGKPTTAQVVGVALVRCRSVSRFAVWIACRSA